MSASAGKGSSRGSLTTEELAEIVEDKAGLPGSKAHPSPERRILSRLLQGPGYADELDGSPSSARVSLGRLREYLEQFFTETLEGRCLPERITIAHSGDAKGKARPYSLQIVRNPFPFEQLWKPYVDGTETLLVWTEPLVFYDKENRCYVRYLELNSDSSDPKRTGPLTQGHAAASMIPCFGYQSSGDVESVYYLEKILISLGIVGRRALTRHTAEDAVSNSNVVVVGNKRMNAYVHALQAGMDFTVEDKDVVIRNPVASKGERGTYSDYEPEAGEWTEDRSAFVVLTRRPNRLKRRTVTMIAGNHGRAIQQVAQFLINGDALERVRSRLAGAGSPCWPTRFQVLFEVKVSQDSAAVAYQLPTPVAFRDYPRE